MGRQAVRPDIRRTQSALGEAHSAAEGRLDYARKNVETP